MIDAGYCQMMARYNAWQNKGLRAIVDAMDEEELRRDRGAFFGSILGTLNHLLWGDLIWMARFQGTPPPAQGIPESPAMTSTPTEWSTERFRTDGRITLWADKLNTIDLVGPLTWYSGAMDRAMHQPLQTCIMHFFNHQTHHRGQVHAMLTAAGAKPGPTDLAFMPEDF